MGIPNADVETGASASERLLRLATRACETARKLDAASRTLSGAVSTGDVESVLEALEVREPLVAQLQVEHQEIQPLVRLFHERAGELWPGVTEMRQREVRRVLAELDELVTAVTLRDAADQTALQAQRVRLGQQLALASQAKAAGVAYMSGGPTEPMFQDRVG